MAILDKACWDRGCPCYDPREGEGVEVVRKEWVDLTDEDIDAYALEEGVTGNKAPSWLVKYARGIESIVKERNK
jgi:hypothetical protein